ncbi:hypothetical protein ACFWAR_11595 [Streptomyces sp. NPDC059917]|uniref:hypothetical protein n=1 Tax=Streptomyces sp. NPDC059917 TaxID=3347002 RepID=UPI00364D9639
MIIAFVDTTSAAYAAGRVCGVLAVALVPLVLLWWLTRSWRTGPVPAGVHPARAARTRKQRRLLIIGATVAIAAAATVSAVLAHDPAPRAADARAAEAPADSAGSAPFTAFVPPDAFEDYRLLTGEAAARAEAGGGTASPRARSAYYSRNQDDQADLRLLIRTADSDPSLHEARPSIETEFHSYFAGAKARDVARFAPGKHRGAIGCGHITGPDGEQSVCAWSDAYTFAGVALREPDLATAAKTTLALRDAGMR